MQKNKQKIISYRGKNYVLGNDSSTILEIKYKIPEEVIDYKNITKNSELFLEILNKEFHEFAIYGNAVAQNLKYLNDDINSEIIMHEINILYLDLKEYLSLSVKSVNKGFILLNSIIKSKDSLFNMETYILDIEKNMKKEKLK